MSPSELVVMSADYKPPTPVSDVSELFERRGPTFITALYEIAPKACAVIGPF